MTLNPAVNGTLRIKPRKDGYLERWVSRSGSNMTTQRNRFEPPSAHVQDAAAERGGRRAALLLRFVGYALVLYWGISLLWRLQYWSLYAQQATYTPALGPLNRALVDLAAVAAGVLLVRRSRWLFIPLLVHCAAFAWFVFSLQPLWFALPPSITLVFASQAAVFALAIGVHMRYGLR
jgi:hypothetical protein